MYVYVIYMDVNIVFFKKEKGWRKNRSAVECCFLDIVWGWDSCIYCICGYLCRSYIIFSF